MSDNERPEDVIRRTREAQDRGEIAEAKWTPVVDPLHPDATEGDQYDISVGEPESKVADDTITMKREEFEALKSQSDNSRAVREGLEGLASKLTPQAAPPLPVNAPKKTAEEFFAEHADDMFDAQKAPKLMREYNRMVMEEEGGPIISSLSAELIKTRRELLESKDPYFVKYKAEVDSLINAQPANVRNQPNIIELAWNQVKLAHQDDILKDQREKDKESIKAELLKELGIEIDATTGKPKAPSTKPPVIGNGTSSRSTQTPATPSGKPKVSFKSQAELKFAQTEAKRLGMDFEDYLIYSGRA